MRKHRDNVLYTDEKWRENDTISIFKMVEAGFIVLQGKRKVHYNKSDGLYFTLDNMKYFEYEFEPC